MSSSLDSKEQERLATLYSYEVMDTAPEDSFTNIVQLAVQTFKVPIAFISFIDNDRIWFKAAHGISAAEMSKEAGLCSHTILSDEPFIVTNALEHSFAKDNMLVTGPLGLRFYCAAPVAVKNGHKLGTICIADTKVRNISSEEITLLKLMAKMVAEQLEIKRESQQQFIRQQDILGHLSHELKNSISLVLGYAGLLKETNTGDGSIAQYCDVILRAGNRMNKLAEEALVIAASQVPAFELKKIHIDLTQVIKETAARFALQAKEKEQEIVLDLKDDVAMEGDLHRVNEIIENLLSNAIKYSPRQKTILLRMDRAEPGIARIMVQDEGPGLTAYDMQKLFQPFTRLSAKPTGGESSTGMGLYIANKLTELHNGKIWAENGASGGAIFYVTLPCQ